MSKVPVATLQTPGRTFGTDWSIANVARLLRSNASRGVWRHSETLYGTTVVVNQGYLRTVSAQHLPTSVSLIFMQLERANRWYASLCFMNADGYLPWNGAVAETWLEALFREDRPRVVEATAGASLENAAGRVRQFTLES